MAIRFLALGNATLDDVVTSDGEIAPRQIGGNGVYAAAGMRLWGVDVSLVSVVGQDFPRAWLEALAAAGIDVSLVRERAMPHALRSRVFYLPDGRRTDRVDEARAILPPHAGTVIDLVTEYTETGSPLHRRTWPLFTPSPEQLPPPSGDTVYAHLAPGALPNNRANATLLSQGGATTSLDWPWWEWDHEGEPDRALLQHVTYLLPSVEELSIHAGAAGQDPFEAARALLALGPRAVAVKLGARGSRVLPARDGAWLPIPPYPAAVVDPTGAGDAFCGGFLVGMAETGDPLQAAQYGTISASFIIEGFGLLHALDVAPTDARDRLRTLRATPHPPAAPP